MSHENRNAIFIYYGNSFDNVPGGVQLCSREYFDALTHAGFKLRTVKVENDMRISNRVKRKLNPEPYNYTYNPNQAISDIKNSIDDTVKYIFLNQYILRPLAESIKHHVGSNIEIVLLSHGLSSVDYLHEIRASANLSGKYVTEKQASYLGRQLIEEALHSRFIDHVFCLSPQEVEIEKWLGAQNATHIPRIIRESALDWSPTRGRMGFVGRLDHPPNKEGLFLVLDELDKIENKNFELRLVGSPVSLGKQLSDKYGFVDYLGELSDEKLKEEASSWSVFLHPIFCFAMGCSTKLAVAIGWEIPIVTTTSGIRGYEWKEGSLQLKDTPHTFAEFAVFNSDPLNAGEIKEQVKEIRKSSPKLDDVVHKIKSALD